MPPAGLEPAITENKRPHTPRLRPRGHRNRPCASNAKRNKHFGNRVF